MTPMNWTPVESSNLKEIAHDERAERLDVRFHNGTRYAYTGVPKAVVDELIAAKSVGRAFHARIRNRFPGRKVEDDQE